MITLFAGKLKTAMNPLEHLLTLPLVEAPLAQWSRND